MQIEKHMVVSMHYSLTDSEGNLLDTSEGRPPLQFLCGADQIISGLENQMLGMQVGEKKSIVVPAVEAYGEYDDELVQEWERSAFSDADQLEEGEVLEFETDDGHVVEGRIAEIDGDTVVIDFNHPLAGEELHFQVEIMDIRPATPEEIAHGHVH
ncbi:MAG: peptidylprolyl isomerase [candidate division KSB1 bacterium]|nr:peptidylprolyl isomerase [candidate division KSB1 bacterium]